MKIEEKYLMSEEKDERGLDYLKTLYTKIDQVQEYSIGYRMSSLLKHFTKEDLRELDSITKTLEDVSKRSYNLLSLYYKRNK